MVDIASPNERLRELALFAGAGGGILGGHLLGWKTVCAVERDAYAAQVLAQRQNDGILPPFPIWSDVCSFDGKPWRGLVDVVSGGFPCQDISSAGKGAGIDGVKSGMWYEMARIVGELRPEYVLVENSPMLIVRGLGQVLGDLSGMGYDCKWGVFSACALDAPHARERLFLLAHANGERLQAGRPKGNERSGEMAERGQDKKHLHQAKVFTGRKVWPQRSPESSISGVADGVANRVDRLKAIGNGQVPIVAATAFNILRGRIEC